MMRVAGVSGGSSSAASQAKPFTINFMTFAAVIIFFLGVVWRTQQHLINQQLVFGSQVMARLRTNENNFETVEILEVATRHDSIPPHPTRPHRTALQPT